jgi:hypothetical protein
MPCPATIPEACPGWCSAVQCSAIVEGAEEARRRNGRMLGRLGGVRVELGPGGAQ